LAETTNIIAYGLCKINPYRAGCRAGYERVSACRPFPPASPIFRIVRIVQQRQKSDSLPLQNDTFTNNQGLSQKYLLEQPQC